jgi:hypothetical protein
MGRRLTPVERRRFLGSPIVGELSGLPDRKVRVAIEQRQKLSEILRLAHSTGIEWLDEPIDARKRLSSSPPIHVVAVPCPSCELIPDALSGRCRC